MELLDQIMINKHIDNAWMRDWMIGRKVIRRSTQTIRTWLNRRTTRFGPNGAWPTPKEQIRIDARNGRNQTKLSMNFLVEDIDQLLREESVSEGSQTG